MSQLKQGQKVLVIRYGKKKDCIEKHSEVINQIGYCWFGKIGVVPSKRIISQIMDEANPSIILYSQGHSYIASVKDIVFETPQEGYPRYYDKELFGKHVFPKSYYKLIDINLLNSDDLRKIKVVSSGSPIIETLNKSMSSFFFAEYGKCVNKRINNIVNTIDNSMLGNDDCIYRKEGICSKKGFVNFKYPCERPSSCVRQKR